MNAPNSAQIAGQLRTLLAAGGPLAAIVLAKTGISASDYALYLEAALAIVPPLIAAAWSWWAKRDAAIVAHVESIPGVKLVVTNPNIAPTAAVDAAEDHSRFKVEMAPNAPDKVV